MSLRKVHDPTIHDPTMRGFGESQLQVLYEIPFQIKQNLQKNLWRIFFKSCSPPASNFIQKETLAQVFSMIFIEKKCKRYMQRSV